MSPQRVLGQLLSIVELIDSSLSCCSRVDKLHGVWLIPIVLAVCNGLLLGCSDVMPDCRNTIDLQREGSDGELHALCDVPGW